MYKILIIGLTFVVSLNCFASQGPAKVCRSINPFKSYSLNIQPNETKNITRIILLKNESEPLVFFHKDLSPFENDSNYTITGSDDSNSTLMVHFIGRFANVRLYRDAKKTIKAFMVCNEI